VYYELLGDKTNNVVPQTKEAVAQCLISFENSINRMTSACDTPDYSKAVIWLQLRSGDNRDMSEVVTFVRKYVEVNPRRGLNF